MSPCQTKGSIHIENLKNSNRYTYVQSNLHPVILLITICYICFYSDGAHEVMLAKGRKPQTTSKETRSAEEYEALQSFLRSISSTATLPPYVKGETYSSVRGVFNQV